MNDKLREALAIVEKYGMKGDVIYKEIEALAASKQEPQAQAGEPGAATNEHTERADLIRKMKELADALPFEGGKAMDYAAELVAKAAALLEAQPAREWVGLNFKDWNGTAYTSEFRAGAEWAESKLREKNAGQPAADDKAMTPTQINEVNETLWAELDEIKDKTGYNTYRQASRGMAHWTLLGYLLNLKHRADDKAGGEPVAWKHVCNALCVDDLELWVDRCPHCGKPRRQPQAEVRVPDGYVLVPVEPTREMVNAAMRECGGIGGGSCGEHTGVDGDDMRAVFFAMLTAATKPQDDLPAILKKQAS